MKVFYINQTKTYCDPNNGVQHEEKVVYPCVFEKVEDANKLLVEISKNRGYETHYNEDGVLINSIFNNTRRGITVVLEVESFHCAKSYEDFMEWYQDYCKSEED